MEQILFLMLIGLTSCVSADKVRVKIGGPANINTEFTAEIEAQNAITITFYKRHGWIGDTYNLADIVTKLSTHPPFIRVQVKPLVRDFISRLMGNTGHAFQYALPAAGVGHITDNSTNVDSPHVILTIPPETDPTIVVF